MILEMSKVRVLGPRALLPDVLRSIQRFGLIHLTRADDTAGVKRAGGSQRQERRRRQLERVLEDVDFVLSHLPSSLSRVDDKGRNADTGDFARWARLARRLRRRVAELEARESELEEERSLIAKYRDFLRAFDPLLSRTGRSAGVRALGVILRAEDRAAIERLEKGLRETLGDGFTLESRVLRSGDLALLIILPAAELERVEEVLAEVRVPEVSVPEAYGESLQEAVPRMLARYEAIPRELEALEEERARAARQHGGELERARCALHDEISELEAQNLSGVTERAFVIEGWLPAGAVQRLVSRIDVEFEDEVVVEEVSTEEWTGEEAPVVLSNPRIFRPFEALVRLMPLPRYGTIDPTPFVAIFFPMFFGIMLGDIGYGAMLGFIALILHRRSKPKSALRTVAEIAGPCALFTVIFGFLYGELFGDLGRRWLGLEPLLFDREESLLAALVLAVGIGIVHVILGLALGVLGALRGAPRQALGRGVAALMVILILVALLAVLEVLPGDFFTPTIVFLIVLFPVLVIAEGFIAPVEFLSTVANVLSYVRIMAVGTASVMLAVVANRMVGAVGSIVVGAGFALLFHLVNFAIGAFSPAVHALRLHYVEFFGKFYSPGGNRYEPFRLWSPGPNEGT